MWGNILFSIENKFPRLYRVITYIYMHILKKFENFKKTLKKVYTPSKKFSKISEKKFNEKKSMCEYYIKGVIFGF